MAQYALDFDGLDDYVRKIGSIFASEVTAITVEAWVKVEALTTARYQVIATEGTNKGFWFMVIPQEDPASDDFSFIIQDTSNAEHRASWSGIVLGTWYYVVGTWDGSNIKLYVNGDLKDTTSFSGSIRTTVSENFVLGAWTNVGGNWWNGIIDEVRISTVARGVGEILANWNNGNGEKLEVDGDTRALWHIDEGADATIYDETANNNDGTIDGASWVDGFPFGIVPLAMHHYRMMRET